jgi:hypothetical protein
MADKEQEQCFAIVASSQVPVPSANPALGIKMLNAIGKGQSLPLMTVSPSTAPMKPSENFALLLWRYISKNHKGPT